MTLDLFDEARELLTALARVEAPYALAGAIALAIHGAPRATTDIDILVPPEAVELVLEVARRQGFDVPAMPIRYRDGMEIQRVSKVTGDELLTLDILIVDENLAPVFADRVELQAEFGPVQVVSRSGLIQMKSWAGRDQDLADIARLQDLDR